MSKSAAIPDEQSWSFRRWYEENKVEFNEKRRKRYQLDADYRQRVLDMNRLNREKRQKDKLKEDQERRKAVTLSAAPTWKEIEGDDGKPMLTIGALSKLLGRSTQTIRIWEKKGLIPQAVKRVPAEDREGDRLYTPDQALQIYESMKDKRQEGLPDPDTDLAPTEFNVQLASGEQTTLKLFSIGVLARAVNRSVLTLEQMERKNVFPETPFRDPPATKKHKGQRYYTHSMIEVVREVFDQMGGLRLRGEHRKQEFKDKVLGGWDKAGVVGAKLLNAVEKEQAQS